MDNNIRCDLQNKADKLYSLVSTRSVHITVQDCYECLHSLYPTGNTYQEPVFETSINKSNPGYPLSDREYASATLCDKGWQRRRVPR